MAAFPPAAASGEAAIPAAVALPAAAGPGGADNSHLQVYILFQKICRKTVRSYGIFEYRELYVFFNAYKTTPFFAVPFDLSVNKPAEASDGYRLVFLQRRPTAQRQLTVKENLLCGKQFFRIAP